MQYGVDVAVRRADDLDKLMLAEIAARKARGEAATVLDIGSGAGGQSERLAKLGAYVTAIDIFDYTAEFSALKSKLETIPGAGSVTFVHSDIRDSFNTTKAKFDLITCQRTLHYLPYQDAKTLLKNLQSVSPDTLYLSVTGATSAIAEKYQGLVLPIEERFATLSPDTQEVFSISAPLCIYHESELLALLETTGWEVTWSRVSDFGNIKVIASAN